MKYIRDCLKGNKGNILIVIISLTILVVITVLLFLSLFKKEKNTTQDLQIGQDNEFQSIETELLETNTLTLSKDELNSIDESYVSTDLKDNISETHKYINDETDEDIPSTYAKKEELTLGEGTSLIEYKDIKDKKIKKAAFDGIVYAVLQETIKGKDIIAVVPMNFKISCVSGENNISDGLVIYDGTSNTKRNNEFVWIPVQEISEMAVRAEGNSNNYMGLLYDWETDNTGSTTYFCTSNSSYYREPANLEETIEINNKNVGYDSQEAFEKNDGGLWTEHMYQEEFNEMVNSIRKYNGFYIGRYETGGFNSTNVISKKGEYKNSINNTNWYKMYKMQKEFAKGKKEIGSTMIWGCQWDQVMKFVNGNKDKKGNKYIVTQNKKATRHKGRLYSTGSNTNDLVQNIYDLEGNTLEWTLATGGGLYRELRGGSYNNDECASHRSYSYPDNEYDDFRK